MSGQHSVADYIVQRLAREGITDCFGVPGDFAFTLCDAVARARQSAGSAVRTSSMRRTRLTVTLASGVVRC